MAITDWPIEERPREKLLAQGVSALSDAELLAIMLRAGVRGKTAVDLARDLIKQFGNLRGILELSPKDFFLYQGMGPSQYAQLQAALELGRRYLDESMHRQNPLTNPLATITYLTAKLRHYTHEVFACLFLDIRNRVINYEELAHGTLNYTNIYPREIIKRVLENNASAVIFAHNHPSGDPEPSVSDVELTEQLQKALSVIDVRVLDHIIVGEKHVISLSVRGLVNLK